MYKLLRFLPILIFILGIGVFQSQPSKAQSLTAQNPAPLKIKPYYENGILMGKETEPFDIKTYEGVNGTITLGCVKQLGENAFFVKVLPETELYDRLFDMMDEINTARYTLYESRPELLGTFPEKGPIMGLKELRMLLVDSDEEGFVAIGDSDEPTVFNFVNLELTDDPDYLPMLFMFTPYVMFNREGDYGTMESFSQKGGKWLVISYDKTTWIPIDRLDPALIRRFMEN